MSTSEKSKPYNHHKWVLYEPAYFKTFNMSMGVYRIARTFVFLLLAMHTYGASAQVFDYTRVEVIDDKVVFTYDLIDSLNARTYTVNLYSSTDNYTTPLAKVSGDVGIEVKPGGNRKITWAAKEEMGSSFVGDIGFEIRGKIYIPFVKLDGFDDYKKFKRNKSYNVTWTGGRGNSVLNFDLYRGEKKISSFPNIANVGHYSIKFENVKRGKDYHLKISDSKNKDDVVNSAPFTIKPKVPFLLKVVPVGVVGYVIYTLISTDPGNDDIVDPVEPPKIN